MAAYSYNDAQFRAAFPAFANTTTYPESVLQMYFDTAGFYVANSNYGPLACAGATLQALYLVTAHLAQIGQQISQGQTSGIVVAATIDKINVTTQQFEYPNQWQFWLGSTEYGKQLLAMLQVQSVGGYYIPGSLGRAGFGVN